MLLVLISSSCLLFILLILLGVANQEIEKLEKEKKQQAKRFEAKMKLIESKIDQVSDIITQLKKDINS